MNYKFNGTITSVENYEIPFQVNDGVASFGLQSKSIPPYKNHRVLLSGMTDNKRQIYLLINSFYEPSLRIMKMMAKRWFIQPALKALLRHISPNGFPEDGTRLPEFYNGTYEYLKSLGIKEL